MYVPVCVQGFSVACTHLKREREGDYFIQEGNRAPVIKATHSRNWGGSVPFAASGTVTPLASGYPTTDHPMPDVCEVGADSS